MKKYLLLLALFFSVFFVFGQICVDSRELYSGGGVTVSYCTTSQGTEGNCRKWNVTVYIRNNSQNTISIAGSNILLASDYGMFPAAGSCAGSTPYTNSSGDVRIAFPGQGLGFVTELSPNYNVSRSFTVYTNKNYPAVSSYMTPFIMKKAASGSQTPKNASTNSEGQNNASTNSNTSKNIQEAIAKFNSLVNQAAIVDQQRTTQIQNNVQNALNSDRNTETFKLNIVNNGIRDLERLIASQKQVNGNQPGSGNGSLQELWAKQTEILKQIKQLEPNTTQYAYEGNVTDKLAYRIQKTQEHINYLEVYLSKLQENQKMQQEAQEKQKSAEKDAFNAHIQKGDDAMANKNYSSAKSYYQSAKTSTTDVNDQNVAQTKLSQAIEAERKEKRGKEIAETKERNKNDNIMYGTMAGSTAGLMAILNDSYSSKGFSGKFLLGLGFENSPMLSNNVSEYSANKSFIEKRNLLTFHTGFNFGILNNQPVSLYIKPEASLGMSAFVPGVSGGFLSYGGSGVLQIAIKKHSKFNVFAEGGWFNYDGTFKYDGAVANNDENSNDVREGKIKYTKIRYGGGFMMRWINHGNETYLRPAVFYEKPSFFTSEVKPVLSMNLQVNLISEILLDFTYTPKTYIPGELLYPNTLEKKNANYFGIKIIRQGKLN